jgi:5,6-dimethylbenzimidazole synthase
MDLYEVIEKRRTIRIYQEPATDEQLRKILLAGSKAPSGRNSQPWEFIIVEDQAIIAQLADLKQKVIMSMPTKTEEDQQKLKKGAAAQKASFNNASIVAVCGKAGGAKSVWLAIENISLAAVAEGLGSGIVLYPKEGMDKIGELLGLPSGYEPAAVLKIGVPGEKGHSRDKNPYAPRRPDFSWLHKDRFQAK